MKNFINRFILSLCFVVTGLSLSPSFIFAQDTNCNQRGGHCHVKDIKTIRTDEGPDSTLLDVIKNAINWCLGILATVVLCFCMYGGFKMLTSGSDSKGYDDGRKILKNALIGLAIIALAWMIVSVVFWFVATMSGGNHTQGTGVQPID